MEYVKLRGLIWPQRLICESCGRKRFCMPYVERGSRGALWWFCLRCARD